MNSVLLMDFGILNVLCHEYVVSVISYLYQSFNGFTLCILCV